MSDDLVRDLTEWCPSDGADAWPIMRQAAAEICSLREQVAKERAGIVAMVRGIADATEDLGAYFALDGIALTIEAQQDKTT